mmetsp:Transcript_4708/g.11935  ORF Transcript_4708/g.11935 Transcript_4708/m.11935 type:complete len:209 (+) Transcript_4708:658-1284(+)
MVDGGLQGGAHLVDDDARDGERQGVEERVVVALEERAGDHARDQKGGGELLRAEGEALAALLLNQLAHEHEDAKEVDDLHGDEEEVHLPAEDVLHDRPDEREKNRREAQGPEGRLPLGCRLQLLQNLVRRLAGDLLEARPAAPRRSIHALLHLYYPCVVRASSASPSARARFLHFSRPSTSRRRLLSFLPSLLPRKPPKASATRVAMK